MRKLLFTAALALAFAAIVSAQQPVPTDNWDSLKFLLGKWTGEGTAEVGKGSGYFTFESDLQGRILVRKNHAEYPATADRPTYVHDDLMIIYRDPLTKQARALFTDNEGHAIHYAVNVSNDGKTITFLSDIQAGAPRYRSIYVRGESGRMTFTLEMAPAGKPEEFKTLIEASVRKASDGV